MAPKVTPRTLKLTVAYDGGNFSGWQKQNGDRTVQSTLEAAFKKILQQPIRVVGAGRTDSGVHAEGQVAHTLIEHSIKNPELHRALNAVLPEEILIKSLRTVDKDFHAQYSAKAKHYRYMIWNHPQRPLLDRNRLVHVPQALDLKKMRQAARLLQGRHNFKAFQSSGSKVVSTVRNLKRLEIRESQGKIFIDAEADGFLYHMVRRLVGLLLGVGQGKVPLEEVGKLLRGRSKLTTPTAPAKGLCLRKVFYG